LKKKRKRERKKRRGSRRRKKKIVNGYFCTPATCRYSWPDYVIYT